MIKSSENLVTDGWMDGRMDGRTDRQTYGQSDFIGCCPTNVERPIIEKGKQFQKMTLIIMGIGP